MPKTKISEFSSTPASNTDIDSINIAEGCAPSGINDAIRELMAQLKDWQSGTSNDPYVVGSSGSLTLNQGTANGVAYLNGSKVVTSGSALTFDGTNLGVGVTATKLIEAKSTTTNLARIRVNGTGTTAGNYRGYEFSNGSTFKGGFLQDESTDAISVFTPIGGISYTLNNDGTSIWSPSGTEAMRLTSTGLGIGTSSPANKLVVNVGSAATNGLYIYGTGGSVPTIYLGHDASHGTDATIASNGGTGNLEIAPRSGYDTYIKNGNLGLGVTPSAWGSGSSAFQNTAGSIWRFGTDNIYFGQNYYFNGTNRLYSTTNNATEYQQGNGEHRWFNAASGTAGNAITFTQAMSLTAAGDLLVGQTSLSQTTVGFSVTSAGIVSTAMAASTSAANSYHLYSTGAGAYRFYVGLGGTINATNTTITAISDQRLKENIRDLDEGLATVMALKPRKFDWKAGKGQDIKNARGFIAQEFEQVFPDMIEEWLDPAPEGEEAYKAINANLIPTLVKAIQELKAEFDAYKASHP